MTPESEVLNAVCDLLQAEHVVAFRMQTGAVVKEHKGKKRVVRFGVKGMSDLRRRFPPSAGRSKANRCAGASPGFSRSKAPPESRAPSSPASKPRSKPKARNIF